MVDIVLSPQELSILTGPSKVDLQIGIGQKGQRGSRIFVGENPPELFFVDNAATALGLDFYDLYINIDTESDEYLYLYQFINSSGSPVWEMITRITPSQVNVQNNASYTAGVATVSIDLTNYFPQSIIDEISLKTIHAVVSVVSATTTVSASIGAASIAGNTLSVQVRAASYNGTSWSALSGSFVTNLSVNFI